MKTYKNLFEKVTSFDNLLSASKKAQRCKRFKREVLEFNHNLEEVLFQIQRELVEGTYTPGSYRYFYVNDPKHRLISAAPYKDRVVHHALCNILAPIFEKPMVHDSYACRVNKGTHQAILRFTQFARRNTYVLKCDVKKFFESIDHDVLKSMIRRKIKDHRLLSTLEKIIGSNGLERGLPIGNLTSQWFANFYLTPFDWFVKQELKCRFYIRYMDDFVVFSDSKDALHKLLKEMRSFLEPYKLTLPDNKCNVMPVSKGINFLGFKVHPTHRVLLKRNIHRMKKRIRYFLKKHISNEMDQGEMKQSISSWIGHIQRGDTFQLKARLLKMAQGFFEISS